MDTEEQLQELAELIREADREMVGEENFADWLEVVGECVLTARKIVGSRKQWLAWLPQAGVSDSRAGDAARAWQTFRELPTDVIRPVNGNQCRWLSSIPLDRLPALWRAFVQQYPHFQKCDIKQFAATHKHPWVKRSLPRIKGIEAQSVVVGKATRGGVRVNRKPRNTGDVFELMELPESHLSKAELAILDDYIQGETQKLRDAWTPEEEASRRGVPTRWYDVTVESCGFIHAPVSPICPIEPLPEWYGEPVAEY